MCSYPVGLDPYRSGCSNSCSYCYVRHRLQDMNSWKVDDPSKLDIRHLTSLFENVFDKGIMKSEAARVLATRLPLRIGMNTDPFQKIEENERITFEILQLLKRYRYPYTLLTKNRLVADDKYLPLYDRDISYLQVTITTLNENMSRKMERGASVPQDRLDAVERLVAERLRVAVRVNPMFPIYPDGYYSEGDKDSSLPALNVFSWDLVEQICELRPSTMIAGFLRVESEKTHRWLEAEAGMDLRPYFRKHKSRKYYSREEIEAYYDKCRAICDDYEVPFTICFDRNENYGYFRSMWANPADCCNGLNELPCFTKTYRTMPAIDEPECIIAIYNKLDKDSPYRSDIFDLFGTPDNLSRGLVGTKDKEKFRSLHWDWGLNGIKKVCKFLYWQQNRSLDGFEPWYRELDYASLPRMIDRLLYVFTYQEKKIAAFVATVHKAQREGGRLWFDFTPEKFVLLPPDFMADYRRDFFSGGREDSRKWSAYFESEYGTTDVESAFTDIFSSAASQDQYHIIPLKYIDKWVEERTDPKVTTRPLFVSSVIDDRKLLAKGLPTANQVFWSIFSQYIGRTQVTGNFSIIVKGSEYSVTDIPVNSFVEKGYVYYHEVGVPYVIFRVLLEQLEEKAYASFKENQFLKIEFHNKRSIGLSESHFLKRAERVGDVAATFKPEYKSTDYDYVLHLSPLGLRRKIAFDLTSGLWRKGFGRTKADFAQQWLHNLAYVPLNNPDIIAVWHYGLEEFEAFDEDEVGRWLIKKSGLRPDQYLYLDRTALSEGDIGVPEDLRLVLMPLYDGRADFLSLTSELKSLNPGQNLDRVKSTGFYQMTNRLIGHLLESTPIN